MTARAEDLVGVTYHDPDGDLAYCYNTEVASMTLDVLERSGPATAWRKVDELHSRRARALRVRPARAGRAGSAGHPMTAFEPRESDGVSWLEARLPGATAAFSTRRGGASEAPYDSLNLGILTDDRPERVIENRRRLAEALGRGPESIAMGHQVHGAAVQLHSVGRRPQRAGALGRAGDRRGRDLPLVLVADCFPLASRCPGRSRWRTAAGGAPRRGGRESGRRGVTRSRRRRRARSTPSRPGDRRVLLRGRAGGRGNFRLPVTGMRCCRAMLDLAAP